ncbi:MAG: hypothetical protein MUE33_10830 [Cytophagaceae bacterium]|nr:hypothetical protein [Cytophagaceae bacterium]
MIGISMGDSINGNIMKNLIIIIVVLILFGRCSNKATTDVYELNKLEIAYANSITLPKDSIKLLIYRPAGICGNTSKEELRTNFIPYLLVDPYKYILESKYKSLKIISVDQLDTLNENINKLYIEFWGDRKSRDTVEVSETFEFKDETTTVEKMCVYKDGNWNVSIK